MYLLIELYEDNAGGLHIMVSEQDNRHHNRHLLYVCHNMELQYGEPDAEQDALDIILDNTRLWLNITIDMDTSIIEHPETRLIACFDYDEYEPLSGHKYWRLSGQPVGNSARRYLAIVGDESP